MEKKQDEQLKCKTNIPEIVEFKSSNPAKSGTGQYGEWHMYAVVNRGVDKVFFPTKFLYDKLQGFSPLQGKTLEVVLIEIDGGKKDWVVKNTDGSQPKAPVVSNSAPQSVPSAKSDDMATRSEIDALNARIDKMGELFTEMRKWQALADKEIIGLKTLAIDLRGKDAVDIHLPAPKPFQFDLDKVKSSLQNPDNIKIERPEGFPEL